MFIIEFFKKINSYVPNFIKRNFGRKIIALFFAILVYVKVSNELSSEKVIKDIPITIIKKGNIEAIGYKPERVSITVQGSRSKLRQITASNIRVEIPVDEISPESVETGKLPSSAFVYSIVPDNIKTPRGVKIAEISPGEISIRLDKIQTKDVPVKVSFQGSLPVDYSIGEIKVVPKSVSISGPDSIIEHIYYLTTSPVVLDNSTVDSFTVSKNFQMSDSRVLISPSNVQVSVDIYKSLTTRLIQNIPISVLLSEKPDKEYNLKFMTDKVSVILGGLNSNLNTIRSDQIKAFVDLSKIREPGTYEMNVECWIMDSEVSLKFIDPPTVKIEVSDP